MSNEFPRQTDVISIPDLQEKLIAARESKDIYTIARIIQSLRHSGEVIAPTTEEQNEMFMELEKARSGDVEVFFAKVPGYMVARWIMIINDVLPGSVSVTDEDRRMINEAAATYIAAGEYHQIASLIFTGKLIGVEIDVIGLDEEGMSEVNQLLKEMQ